MLTALFVLLASASATEPAHGAPAGDPHGHGGHSPVESVPPTAHGESAGHAGGEAHGHHYYTDDDDHDGVANWRDADSGETYVVPAVAWHAVNFGLLAVVGYVLLRRPISDTFRERALGIRHELTDSARRRDEAHQRHQELLARLEKIESEVQAMEREAQVEAKREEEKLVERARRVGGRIAEQAERTIRDETTRARNELRREAVELAVKLAESTLRQGVGHADHQALARDFLTSLRHDGGARRV